MQIEIDLNNSVYKSAKDYYDYAKKQKLKLKSAQDNRELLSNNLEKLKLEDQKVVEKTKMKEKRTTFWFEKYVWSLSTNGHLIVGGRDSTTNEILIKRYLERDDMAFHTNIQGAAFVILKQGKNAKEVDKKDAAQIAACFSRAWKEGFSSIDVYSMAPEQISKSPNPGEYLPKGSFIIRGERQWHKDVELKLNISLINGSKLEKDETDIYLPFVGSESSVKKYGATERVIVQKGRMKKGEAAKKLYSKYYSFLKAKQSPILAIDDYVKLLPSGELDLKIAK